TVYDSFLEALETGSVEALEAYARNLSERIIPRGVETHEVLGIVLLLRNVLARELFKKYWTDVALLNRVQDAYEPAANRIAQTLVTIGGDLSKMTTVGGFRGGIEQAERRLGYTVAPIPTNEHSG